MPDVFTKHAEPRQSEPARPGQVKNNAGGYTFSVADETRLNRFLTIGTEGGTYYVDERKLTRDNAGVVARMAQAGNPALLRDAAAVSAAGRAPSNDQALFAVAAAAGLGPLDTKAAAFSTALPQVARTGMHMLHFVKYAELHRGWGRLMVNGVRNWYLNQSVDDLAYQMLKYKSRDLWAQRDVLRLAMFKGTGRSQVPAEYLDLFAYIMKGTVTENLPSLVYAAALAHGTRDVKDWVRLIEGNRSLSWEMLPSEALAHAQVWRALTEHGNLPAGALLRNLGRMTSLGAIKPLDIFTRTVCDVLTDPAVLKRARIHPLAVLIAIKTYAAGHGLRGKSSWSPVHQVTDALNEMFYASFGYVEPAGKRTLIALDVSGSMSSPHFTPAHAKLYESTGLTPRDITAAMSMTVARTEPAWAITAFSHRIEQISVSPGQRLDDIIRAMDRVPMGGTDCSLPMLWAMQAKIPVDTFQVWTDNETWYGNVHPHRALEQYRQAMGIDARLQVCAAVATQFSIADPLDPRQLDVSGFDSAVPALLASHARGDV